MNRELRIELDGTGTPRVWSHGEEPDWSRPVCFLLHGYNVEAPGAANSYACLFKTIQNATLLPSLLASQSCLVFWQGYASAGLTSGKTFRSPLTYASQIPSACSAAHALKEYVEQKSPCRPQITLIAHSLGCRLALEFLDSYARFPTNLAPEFPLVVLMAAAVPTYFLEDLGRLWRGALLADKRLVLFSDRDLILAGPFRAGQTLAGEGVLPKAVGATGRPLGGFWTDVVPTVNGHSGYFSDSLTAERIATFLGQPTSRDLPTFGKLATTAQLSRVLPVITLDSRSPAGEIPKW
jgi:hypothetical protein